jgi:hypothetical protein
MAAEPDTRNMREASDVAATHPAILLWTDSKQPALLIAEVDIDAATCPLLHGGAEVVDVLASQLDQYSAQRRWIVNRVVVAADRSLAVLVNEVKDPAFIALEVEKQPVHRERVQRMHCGCSCTQSARDSRRLLRNRFYHQTM